MRRITSRFVLLIATAAVLPLVIFGFVSITSLRSGTETSVRDGNGKVARQVAEQIAHVHAAQHPGAAVGRDRARRDEPGALAAGSDPEGLRPRRSRSSARSPSSTASGARAGDERGRRDPAFGAGTGAATPDRPYIAPLTLDDDFAAHDDHRGAPGAVAAGRRLDRRRDLARRAVADGRPHPRRQHRATRSIVSEDGRLIAHGNPDEKRHIADVDQSRAGEEIAFAAEFRNGKSALSRNTRTSSGEKTDGRRGHDHRQALPLWTVVVEQPTAEALAQARGFEQQLLAAIFLALLVTVAVRLLRRPVVHPAHRRAHARHALDRRRQARDPRRARAGRTRSASSATPSTRWPTASSSCRTTSASRNAR